MSQELPVIIRDITNEPEQREEAEVIVISSLDLFWMPRLPDQDIFSERDVILGAFFDDDIVGVCSVGLRGKDTIQIDELAILKHCRNKGVGTELLSYAEKIGVWLARTQVCLVSTLNAREFYARQGYHGPTDSSTDLRKSLLLSAEDALVVD